jgi:hypothetical protein
MVYFWVNWELMGLLRNGHLEVLIWSEHRGILPDDEGAKWAAANGHLEVLIWLEHRGILPDRDGANWAAYKWSFRSIRMVSRKKYIHKLNKNIYLTIK